MSNGGERGWGSHFICLGGRGTEGVIPVVCMLVETGLKPDGAVPKTGMVAVGANEKTGVGKAMLNLGILPSAVEGGERWSGVVRGVSGMYGIDVAGRDIGGRVDILGGPSWVVAATAALIASSR